MTSYAVIEIKTMLLYQPVKFCPYDVIGRRACLRNKWYTPCRFKSYYGHQIKNIAN